MGANLRDKLSTIEEEIYQVCNRANEDPLNFPIKLNNLLCRAGAERRTGDDKTTDQALEVDKVLSERLNKIEANYHNVVQRTLKSSMGFYSSTISPK